MINGYDILYGLGVGVSAPGWLISSKWRGKVLGALRERMGRGIEPVGEGTVVMIHAVSLGEINATRALVKMLREQRPGLKFVVSATTETGFARGKEIYGSESDVRMVRYPLDFSSAVTRVLDAVHPSVVVLMELEAWPNFIRHCERRGIAVVLVNGRLTETSFRRYRWVKPVTARMFRRIHAVCAQEKTYAERFVALGAPRDRVKITGTMKWDTAQIADRVEGAEEIAVAVGLKSEIRNPKSESSPKPEVPMPSPQPSPGVPGEGVRIWLCGSTGPGEEEIALRVYRKLVEKQPGLRLVIVPRHPPRFDEVAQIIRGAGFGLVRRKSGQVEGDEPRVVLGDTTGELRKFYSLADVIFVGRTLVDLGQRQHGSDMMEPAALGKPVVVGPFTGNFAEVMNCFRAGAGIVEVQGEQELYDVTARLLADRDEAMSLGRKAQQVVKQNQGATERHAKIVLNCLDKISS